MARAQTLRSGAPTLVSYCQDRLVDAEKPSARCFDRSGGALPYEKSLLDCQGEGCRVRHDRASQICRGARYTQGVALGQNTSRGLTYRSRPASRE